MIFLHETEWNSSHRSPQIHVAEILEYLFRDQKFRQGRLAEVTVQRFLIKTVADMRFRTTSD